LSRARNIVIALALAVALAVAIQVLASGVGVSGPDQEFQIEQGKGVSSHITVWNEGDGTESFSASFTGNVSQIASVSPDSFTISPGGSQLLNLEYFAPIGQDPGRYGGYIQVSVSGPGISPGASRWIELTVIESGSSYFHIRSGVSLIAWMGPSGDFADLLPAGCGIFKIWMRREDGGYTSAQYYPDTGQWWSPDESFVALETGRAYFIESGEEFDLAIGESGLPASVSLHSGLNLVGWPYSSRPFSEAFQQTASDYGVTKVWRRNAGGTYTFAQYYPGQDQWWSSDGGFTGLDRGSAYFVETTGQVEISP